MNSSVATASVQSNGALIIPISAKTCVLKSARLVIIARAKEWLKVSFSPPFLSIIIIIIIIGTGINSSSWSSRMLTLCTNKRKTHSPRVGLLPLSLATKSFTLKHSLRDL